MKFFCRRFLVCFALAGIFASPFFSPHRVRIPPALIRVAHHPEWDSPPLSFEKGEEIRRILEKPLTYIARGNQSYVFESEGGEYVIKLFRYRFTQFPWIYACKTALASFFFHKKAKDSFDVKLKKTFQAAQLALLEAPDLTQVVFCHLNLTKGTLPIAKINLPRSSFSVNMDLSRFVIQRKVTPFLQAMAEAKKDPKALSAMIDSFRILVLERSARGIRNSDPNLIHNYGFLNGKAIEMDFGNYRKSSFDQKKEEDEAQRLIRRLEEWVCLNINTRK